MSNVGLWRQAIFALAAALMLAALAPPSGAKEETRYMKIIGHRGVPSEAPQNTLASIRRAIELGLDYVELDLRTTADDKIIDMHNSTVDRTTNGQGEVRSMTLAELRKLDAGSWFKPEFRGEKVPLFVEELALCKGRIKLYLDMKAVDPMHVLWLLQQFDMVEDALFLTGVEQLAALQAADPRVQAFPHLEKAEDMPALAEKVHPKYVEHGAGPIDQAGVDAAHAHGAQYFKDIQGAGDTEEHILACLRAGVDAVQTDHPRLVLDVLKRAGGQRPEPGPAPEPPPAVGERLDSHQVKLIGHRGVMKHAPQNTLPSSREAIRLGMDYIEVDLRATADGLLVDIHNDTVDRTTNGHGAVRDLRYAQIRALDAGSWFSPKFKGAYIPLVGEVLALAKDRIGIYLDWKGAPPEPVVRLLQEFDMTRDVLAMTGPEDYRRIHELDPSVPVMIGATSVEQIKQLAATVHPQAIEIHFDDVSLETVRACKDAGMLAVTSHANGRADTPEGTREAVAAGIQAMETDNPEMVLEVLRSLK